MRKKCSNHPDSFGMSEECFLGPSADPDDDLVEDLGGTREDIDMSIRYRIERAGIDRFFLAGFIHESPFGEHMLLLYYRKTCVGKSHTSQGA